MDTTPQSPASVRRARQDDYDAVTRLLEQVDEMHRVALPWLFRARSGRRGIWISTGFVIAILISFPFVFFAGCVVANCGQGAIAIFVLGPIWIASAVVTVAAAALASYGWRQSGRHD